MIRRAEKKDREKVEKIYEKIISYEETHVKYTAFRAGIYPTKSTADEAFEQNCLFVCEESGEICGCIIIDHIQSKEYGKIGWRLNLPENEVAVIHLLCIDPDKYCRGFGTKLLNFAADWAIKEGCKSIRLDTGRQNIPARTLYEKNGFEVAGAGGMTLGGVLEHDDHLFYEKILAA